MANKLPLGTDSWCSVCRGKPGICSRDNGDSFSSGALEYKRAQCGTLCTTCPLPLSPSPPALLLHSRVINTQTFLLIFLGLHKNDLGRKFLWDLASKSPKADVRTYNQLTHTVIFLLALFGTAVNDNVCPPPPGAQLLPTYNLQTVLLWLLK